MNDTRLILPPDVVESIRYSKFADLPDKWQWIEQKFGIRGKAALGRVDRFYLLVKLLHRKDAIHPWLYARCRDVEYAPDDHLDLWAREHYKDLANDTPVLTHNRGWATHGDLVPGDTVYSPDGAVVKVLAVSPQYTDSECYEITFDDKARVIAGAGHLWKLRCKHRHRVDGKESRDHRWTHEVVETKDLAVRKGRIDVGCAAPLQGEQRELPMDPYVFGVWLGDGASAGGHITCAYKDAELIDHLRGRGVTVHERKSSNINSGTFVLDGGVRGKKGTGATATLRKMGVIRNKHIPVGYMTASIEQRLWLLRGLMDTDGTCDTRGRATFCQMDTRLARQVFDLAAGLGFKPKMNQYQNGGKGYWQVCFQARASMNPFMLRRKAARAIPESYYKGSRTITSITRCETVPTRCIQVEGGMYLVGKDLVPTHNSTIITYAGSIQEILADPDITIGLFSHVRPIAKAFLGQIKSEFELNEELKAVYPDVLWADPKRDAPRAGATWNSERIDVKRQSNPKEGTIEAWGLVDGQPTSKHYRLRIYDDVVTRESVTTPEQVAKTTAAWELSDNLGARQEDGEPGRRWHIGTRYSFADTYGHILEKKILTPRIHAATDDGTLSGNPVFLTPSAWTKKLKDNSEATIACQQLQNPAAGQQAMFRKDQLRFIDIRPATLNIYIMVDPASSKKKGSDSTAMAVIAVDAQRNKYLIDGYCHKMNLQERWTYMSQLRKHWMRQKGVQAVHVGYERYGIQSDLEYFEEKMQGSGDSFPIKELNWPNDGPGGKADRIQRLVPDFGHGKFFLIAAITQEVDGKTVPAESAAQKRCREQGEAWRILTPIKRRDHEGNLYALNKCFLDEYLVYPYAIHDDLLDACSRIYDIDYVPPIIVDQSLLEPESE